MDFLGCKSPVKGFEFTITVPELSSESLTGKVVRRVVSVRDPRGFRPPTGRTLTCVRLCLSDKGLFRFGTTRRHHRRSVVLRPLSHILTLRTLNQVTNKKVTGRLAGSPLQ